MNEIDCDELETAMPGYLETAIPMYGENMEKINKFVDVILGQLEWSQKCNAVLGDMKVDGFSQLNKTAKRVRKRMEEIMLLGSEDDSELIFLKELFEDMSEVLEGLKNIPIIFPKDEDDA